MHMDKSMIKGITLGGIAMVVLGAGAVTGVKTMMKPEFAEVVAVKEVIKTVEAALNDGAPVLWLADKKGRRVGIPSDKVAYVEITEEDAGQRVGFGTG